MKVLRTVILATVFALVAGASAQDYIYSDLNSSDGTLTGHSGTQTLSIGGGAIGPNGTIGIIDFFPTNASVGDGTGRSTLRFTLGYTSSATTSAGGVGLELQGTIGGRGTIQLTENIFDMSNNLIGSITNTLRPGSTDQSHGQYTNNGNTYTYLDSTLLNPSVQQYRVEKTFLLNVGENYNGNVDFASLGIVEQSRQPVPEPATFAALGLGAICLLRRRTRK